MKKGQMSLEMIIGLLILLVVAIVVIRMFLTNIVNIDKPGKDIDQVLKEKGFQSTCEGLCSDYLIGGSQATLARYCFTKMSGDPDLNRNGLIDTISAKTKVLDICEDTIYCFHISPCKSDTGTIDWEDCRQVVCRSYYDIYKDWDTADKKVKELFPSAGTCKLTSDANWWKMYFGNKPCTDPPTGEGLEAFAVSQLQSCTINITDSTFRCNAQYTGICEAADFGFMANDTVGTVAAVMPGNEDAVGSCPAGALGSVIFENNVIRGTITICGTTPLTIGNCGVAEMLCDTNSNPDDGVEVDISPSSCAIVI